MQKENKWIAYIENMKKIFDLKLNEERNKEVLKQFNLIANMAIPLMEFSIDDRLEISGVYKAWN